MDSWIMVDAEISAIRLQRVAYVLARHLSVPDTCLRYAGDVDYMRLVQEWAKADRETFSRMMEVRMSPFDKEDLYRYYVTQHNSFTAPFMANPALALPGRGETLHLSDVANAVLSSCEGGMEGPDARRLQEAYMFKPTVNVVKDVFYQCCAIGRTLQPCALSVTRKKPLSSTYKLHLQATVYSGVDESALVKVLHELQLVACRSAGAEPEKDNNDNTIEGK